MRNYRAYNILSIPSSSRYRFRIGSYKQNKEGLELLNTAIEKVVIGMDVAASEFYGTYKTYDLNFKEENNDGSEKISGEQLKYFYKSFISEYPIVSIEDPFDLWLLVQTRVYIVYEPLKKRTSRMHDAKSPALYLVVVTLTLESGYDQYSFFHFLSGLTSAVLPLKQVTINSKPYLLVG